MEFNLVPVTTTIQEYAYAKGVSPIHLISRIVLLLNWGVLSKTEALNEITKITYNG